MANNKVIVMLIATVMVSAVFAGCLGGSGDNGNGGSSGGEKKQGKEVTKTLPQQSGWAQSDGSGSNGDGEASVKIDVKLNDSNVVKVTFKIHAEDSDSNHSSSDEGSNPDEIEGKIDGGGNFSQKMQKGTTPYDTTVEFPSKNQTLKEGEFLPQQWTVEIDGHCKGGKPYPAPLPISPLVYKDQGFSWTLNIEYHYIDYNATSS